MTTPGPTRREFLGTGLAAGAAGMALTARSFARVPGANDTIRLGIVGCGARNNWHIEWVNRVRKLQPAKIVAACDIWRQRREEKAAIIQEKFGDAPKLFKDYRELLEDNAIDAVIIATPDHQHCTMLGDAVGAGKDVYIEKPIAMELDELNRACDIVKASRLIVQHGTQGRSCRGADTARDFIRSGKLGKLLRIEESRSFYEPYWNGYRQDLQESDTDWKAFLMHRPHRPFDADQYTAWMGYRDFSSGTVGGWMSHMSDLIHYVTGCGFPKYAVSQGGIYSPTSVQPRDCPDTVTAIIEYPDGFTTSYTTHFGNGANDYMKFFGTAGTMETGYPDGFPNGIAPRVSGIGGGGPEKLPDDVEVLDNSQDENHMVNWLRCIRTREQPKADMDAGYRHGVAAILADRAYAEGRRMMFDAEKREIRPA